MGKKRNLGALQLSVLTAALFVVICCAQACLAYTPGDPEFRAFWVDAWHAGMQNQAQVDNLLGVVGDPNSRGTVRDTNCNAVVVQVRRDCNANYPSSMGEPYMSGLTPADFNGLQAVINAAHDTTGGKRRIEVHAWMVTFRTSGGQVYEDHNDTPTGSLTNLDNYWPSRDQNGNEVGDKAFDPGHPLAEQYTVDVAMDLVNNFDIDGIHFDYIRFTANNQGYNPTSIARYNARYGTTGQPAPTDERFKQWRRDQVTSVIRKVYAEVQASKPWVKVSASFVTWNPSPRESTRDGFKATRPYYDVFCDWDAWLQEGIIDAAMPMTYYNWASLPNDYVRWMNFEKDRHGNRHMYIGPGIYMNSLTNSIRELQMTRDPSPAGNYADGWVGFSYFAPYTFGGTNYGSWNSFTPSLTSQVTATPADLPNMPWKSTPTKGHIMGTVTVKTTGLWADGATVTLTGPEMRTLTCDGTGFYAFIDLTPGVYTVTASMAGLPDCSRTVNVQLGVRTGNMYVTDMILGGPIISGIRATQITTTSERIEWQTDVGSTSRVEYGLTTSYGSTTTVDPSMVTAHSVLMTGLAPKTLYHYRVISGNPDGTTVSGDRTFTTLGPPEISGVGYTALTNYGATIIWNTDQASTTQVQYGLTTSYGSTTTLNQELVTSHSQMINALAPLTMYHYRVISSNGNGTSTSGDYTFSTSGVPVITAGSVTITNVTANGATISWLTNAPSSSTVNYGPTTSYGAQKTDSTLVTNHTITLTGLTQNKLYHFQCNSVNPYGTSTTGDYTFTTLIAPVVSNVRVTGVTASSATISWNTDQVTDSAVTYGYMTNVYEMQSSDPAMGTSHTVTLTGLTSATKYHFKCLSTNATGTGSSADTTFDTSLSGTDIVVDDASATRIGSWSSGTTGYNSTNKYKPNTTTSQTVSCQWSPSIPTGAYYDIYVYYPTSPGAYPATTHASYKICGDGDEVESIVDQSVNPYRWNLIATHIPFGPGTTGYVKLNNMTGEAINTTTVTADAVKLVFVALTGPPAITDVAATPASTSATITWKTDQKSTSFVDYGTTTSYGSTVSDSTPVAAHSIVVTGLLPNTTYHYRVRSSNSRGETSSDDYSFRTPPVDMIVDNTDPGATFPETGWSTGTYSGRYGADYRFATATGGDPTTSCSWAPSLPLAGYYDVYCWYNTGSNRSTAAKYTINTYTGPMTIYVDQTYKWYDENGWVPLAFNVQLAEGSAGTVTLDNSGGAAGKVVIADAIRWKTSGVTTDTTPPTVTISSPSASQTRSGPVSYTVMYNDNYAVTGVTLTPANVTLNTTGTATGTITVTGGGTTYRTVTISNITGSGSLGISIGPGTATDSRGNLALPSDQSITFSVDNTPPAIIIGPPSTSLTSGGPVSYTVWYEQASSVSLTSSNITLNQVGTTNGTVTVSGTGNATRTVTISGITGDGELGFTIGAGTAVDALGNAALESEPSMTFSVDNSTVPSAAISDPSVTTTTNGPVTYTIFYDSANDISLSEGDVTLNTTGTAHGAVTVTGEGTAQRTVTISDITGAGTIGISLAAGTATSANGASCPAAGPSATFTVAAGVATVSIGAPSATMTSTAPVSYAVNYTNAGAITLASTDVTLNKTGTANGTVTVTGSDPTSRTVTISGITGNGTLGISIAAGTAGAGAPGAGPSATFMVDNTPPVMTSVTDDKYTTLTNSLFGTWYGSDPESNIARYEYAVGTDRVTALTDIMGWTSAGVASWSTITPLALQVGRTYYISARAVNAVGLTSAPMTSAGVAVCHLVNNVLAAKALPLDAPVDIADAGNCVVTAIFPGCFYIEDQNRVTGIRVQCPAPAMTVPGNTLHVVGILGVNADGERAVLEARADSPNAGNPVAALATTTKFVGGATFGATPGITGGKGVNNTGLLVKISGKVTRGYGDGFCLDDGSTLVDEAGNTGIKIVTGASGLAYENANVTVTGVVSCHKVGSTVYPQIVARDVVTH